MSPVITSVVRILFGCCRHKRHTFPITPKPDHNQAGYRRHGTYVVCLDCGSEFPYDWEHMRVIWTPLNVVTEYPAGPEMSPTTLILHALSKLWCALTKPKAV